ncbi:MAG: ABC transporter permease subunit [Verrucomicrobiota bacterium]
MTERLAGLFVRAMAMTVGVVLICLFLKGVTMWGDWRAGGSFWLGWDGSAMRVIGERIPASLALYGMALVLSVGLGIPLGCWWGERRWGWLAGLASFFVAVVVAIPAFWLAAMGVYSLGNVLALPVLADAGGRGWWPGWWQVMVPAGVVGLTGAGLVAGRVRRSLLEASEHAAMAVLKARGMGYRQRVAEYALPASGMTLAGVAGEMLPVVVGLSVAVEWAWYFPGLGSYAGAAIREGDVSGVLLVALAAGLATVVLRFLIELIDLLGSRGRRPSF